MAHTIKVECPKCKSDDCNSTYVKLGELINLPIATMTTFCNHCTYTKVCLLVSNKELVIATREPRSEDTEIDYMYLGRERG